MSPHRSQGRVAIKGEITLKSKHTVLYICVIVFGICQSTAHAQQPKGYIQNHKGEKCWYTQITTEAATYFHSDGITSNTSTLTFDNPTCMADDGESFLLDVNKMMINNVITRPYSHSDANFQTRVSELLPTSLLQIKGQCIQSKKYPLIGVTIDYIIRNRSITQVKHGPAAGGCKNQS